jgi:MFS superfamily sulfate permease-like transporter
MTIILWRVLDNRIVDACLAPALWLAGLTIAAVLLPESSALEILAEFLAFWATVILICKLIAALAAPLFSSG